MAILSPSAWLRIGHKVDYESIKKTALRAVFSASHV